MDDLIAEASEEATQGSKQYADGQSQLSAAMIPYSMKYTDVYTANLSALTGGTSSGATAYESQATPKPTVAMNSPTLNPRSMPR